MEERNAYVTHESLSFCQVEKDCSVVQVIILSWAVLKDFLKQVTLELNLKLEALNVGWQI